MGFKIKKKIKYYSKFLKVPVPILGSRDCIISNTVPRGSKSRRASIDFSSSVEDREGDSSSTLLCSKSYKLHGREKKL